MGFIGFGKLSKVLKVDIVVFSFSFLHLEVVCLKKMEGNSFLM